MSAVRTRERRFQLHTPLARTILNSGRPDLSLLKPKLRRSRRSIANLDSAEYPPVPVPVALANEAAYPLSDLYRRGRIINRRWRRSGTCQDAAEQRPADKSTHHASRNLP